jgi:hypothetical protein
MQEALLWKDFDPKRSLADKIARAAARYRTKFGVRPNLCYINISQMNGVEASSTGWKGRRSRACGCCRPRMCRQTISGSASRRRLEWKQ